MVSRGLVYPQRVSRHTYTAPKSEIAEKFGSLDDIPYELANSLANVYYKFTAISINGNTEILKGSDLVHWALKKYVQKGLHIFKAYKKFFH
jgi:hypothetical protein